MSYEIRENWIISNKDLYEYNKLPFIVKILLLYAILRQSFMW